MFSEVIGTFGESGSLLWGVSNYGVLDAVHMWMLSFLPMHHICAKSFMSNFFAVRPEIFLKLRDYELTMNSFIETVSGYLENLKKRNSLSIGQSILLKEDRVIAFQ